jgi:2-polyprenyl-6-methoxyphenol hydroxylase-like FAD-dependent oxidoreductase
MSNTVNIRNAQAGSLPILIAGAGPTGLTAALELTRFGLPVRIIDKEEAPAATSGAIGVHARTLELMEMRGLADQFIQFGRRIQGVCVYGGGKRIFRLDFSRLHTHYNYVLAIPQSETERILRDRLEQDGVPIEQGTELTAFKQDDSSVMAVLKHKDGTTEEYRASYLIDAEGAHSIVRETLGLKFEGKTFDQSYALADLSCNSELSDTDFHFFSSEHGFAGLLSLGERRFRFIADHPLNNLYLSNPTLEECQAIYSQRSIIPARFRDMNWSSYFHINNRMVSRFRVGRVFLGGDAAHIHSPAGGQGMNSGIQDMINLAWKLAFTMNGHGTPELLDTYQQDRVPVIRDVLKKTEGITDMISSVNRIFRALFNELTPMIASSNFIQENSTERVSQLAVNYRGSPISEDHGTYGGIHAGERVPDVLVRLIASSETDHMAQMLRSVPLFQLLHPSRFSLLVLADQSQNLATLRIEQLFHDWSGSGRHPYVQILHIAEPEKGDALKFGKIFARKSDSNVPLLYFVRPDGYVGFRGQLEHLDRLRNYWTRWLIKAPAVRAAA